MTTGNNLRGEYQFICGARIIVIGFVFATIGYFLGTWRVYHSHPELSQTERAQALVAKIGKLIKLPQGEMPQMATITDAETVKKGQPFLANAENGDVLFVYPAAQEALLYRPTANQLITVGPIESQPPRNPAQIEQPASAAKLTTATTSSTYATSTKKK